MLYFLAIPKNSGGAQIVNGHRAAVVSIPDDTDTDDALTTAQAVAAAADPLNSHIWGRATGGYMSDSSLSAAEGIASKCVFFDASSDTPEVLTGDGTAGALASNKAVVTDGDTFNTADGVVTVAVEDNVATMTYAAN